MEIPTRWMISSFLHTEKEKEFAMKYYRKKYNCIAVPVIKWLYVK